MQIKIAFCFALLEAIQCRLHLKFECGFKRPLFRQNKIQQTNKPCNHLLLHQQYGTPLLTFYLAAQNIINIKSKLRKDDSTKFACHTLPNLSRDSELCLLSIKDDFWMYQEWSSSQSTIKICQQTKIEYSHKLSKKFPSKRECHVCVCKICQAAQTDNMEAWRKTFKSISLDEFWFKLQRDLKSSFTMVEWDVLDLALLLN